MSCAKTLSTQAFIDGEVSGVKAALVERHIEACVDCQAFCADAAALSDAILTRTPRYAARAALRRRVEAMLNEEDARRAPPPLPIARRAAPGFWRGAFSGAGLTALAAGLGVLAILPPSAATLADQVTAAHTNAMIQGRAIQVISTDHHTIKPWFAGRLPLSPPVADFAAQGYKLIGGRLDKVAGAPAAVVVYQHCKHEIDLFVWADRGPTLPPTGLSHGYHWIFWKNQGLVFAAVFRFRRARLASFVNLVRTEPE